MSSDLELWGGIECTVNRVDDRFVDQLVLSGHDHRDDDIDRLASLSIRTWRYPVLWERVAPHGTPDFRWADRRLHRMRDLGLEPIVGLVHHGSGPFATDLRDVEFPARLADFARATARRYPWVRRWTPINEPLSTARFSGLDGHWYPHGLDAGTFARIVVNECRGIQRAMTAIRAEIPDAELVLTEDVCRHTATPRLAGEGAFRNTRRWLAVDLVLGRVDGDHPLQPWLIAAGIAPEELEELIAGATAPAILGANYYVTSDRFLDEHPGRQPPWRRFHGPLGPYGEHESVRCLAGGIGGHRALLHELWDRYHLPLAITEVHLGCTREEQVRWLLEAWDAARLARAEGVDVRAVTAWGAFGLVGWDQLVRTGEGAREIGLFDVRSSPPRPTALARVARALATGDEVDAPYGGPGWWRRPDRLHGHPPIEAPDPGVRPRLPLPPPRPARALLVTGIGAFARVVIERCRVRGLDVAGLPWDAVESEGIEAVLDRLRPWAVVHAAGLRDRRGAEHRPERAERLHHYAPAALAAACARRGVRFVHLSSSLVLSGPGPHTESAERSPRSTLGAAQARGELASLAAHPHALVVRSGELVALERDRLTEVLAAVSAGRSASVPDPASAAVAGSLADVLLDLLVDGEGGVWHLAHRRSLLQLVRAAVRLAGLDPRRVRGEVSDAALLTSERGHLLPPVEEALSTRWNREHAQIEEVTG